MQAIARRNSQNAITSKMVLTLTSQDVDLAIILLQNGSMMLYVWTSLAHQERVRLKPRVQLARSVHFEGGPRAPWPNFGIFPFFQVLWKVTLCLDIGFSNIHLPSAPLP